MCLCRCVCYRDGQDTDCKRGQMSSTSRVRHATAERGSLCLMSSTSMSMCHACCRELGGEYSSAAEKWAPHAVADGKLITGRHAVPTCSTQHCACTSACKAYSPFCTLTLAGHVLVTCLAGCALVPTIYHRQSRCSTTGAAALPHTTEASP